MVEIEIRYEGGLHTRCLHGPSRAELATDAPVDNRGRGESFSPTDLLATGLGSCMLTTMGILAEREGWTLDGARARVEKHMVAEPSRRVGRLVVELSMPAGLPADSRAPLERAARGCPVRESLHPDVALELSIDWGA